MGGLDAEAERILSQAAARLVRGHDGLLSSGSIRINDVEVRGENSRGKGQQPGAQHKTCCLLMANSFYCTSKSLYSAGSQMLYLLCLQRPKALLRKRVRKMTGSSPSFPGLFLQYNPAT